MAIAERDGDRIILQTEYRERELVKQIPGAKWSTAEQTWWCPLSWAGCVQARGVFGAELGVGPELAAWARSELAERVQPCLALRGAEDVDEPWLATLIQQKLPALYPYQRAGVAFLARARQALCADEMGLGKTVSAIATLEVLPDAYPALIVAPNSMKATWAEEFARWVPERRVVVVAGGAGARRKQIAQVRDGAADVAVINWEGLRGHTRLEGYGSVNLTDKEREPKELNEIAWRTVIADEAHRAKDPRAKQTRALWWVGRDAEYRYALTGTPVANSPEDAWTLMRFVAPREFPAKTKFVERYALQSWNVFGFMQVIGVKSETREELFKILDPRFIRRLKAAVLPQLPPKTYTTRTVELEPKQRKAYDSLRTEMLAELETGVLLATNPLARATRLVQFASAYGQVDEEGNLTLTAPSCKVDALVEIVAELGTQKAVVFAESRQLIELAAKALVKEGYRVGQVTGAVPAHERQQSVQAFQTGDLQVLLLTLGAGGEGLTLHAASIAIFLQRSWSAVKNLQAEDRIHRIGQEAENIEIVDVIAADTIEQRVHEARTTKGEMLEEIARDAETLRRWLEK